MAGGGWMLTENQCMAMMVVDAFMKTVASTASMFMAMTDYLEASMHAYILACIL